VDKAQKKQFITYHLLSTSKIIPAAQNSTSPLPKKTPQFYFHTGAHPEFFIWDELTLTLYI
jgi:hypothetical protein